jgi:pyroglutamyl-peptidase
MRVLVYGFGPYRHFQENVTEQILRELPKQRRLKTIVFPVKFHKSQFIDPVKEFRPGVVLGLGQCSTGRLLKIEARAVNRRRGDKSGKTRPIIQGGADILLTNLELNFGRAAKASRDAGDYVCNYSMYVILDFLKRRHLPIPFGFIHVPHGYNKGKAARLLLKAVDELRTGE